MVNPQVCVGYFSVPLPLYDGDALPSVVDRVRRIIGVPGECPVTSPCSDIRHTCPSGAL